MLLTAASMVGSINAIVGGMAVALVLRSLLDAPVPVAAVAGTLVGLGLAAACFAYQVRRFRQAAAVVPEPYERQGPAAWVTYRVTRQHGQPLGRDLIGRTSNPLPTTPPQQHRQPDSKELRGRLWSAEDHA